MDVYPLNRYSQDSLDNLLTSIPFYKSVKRNDRRQYDLLMSYSRVVECYPGEVLLEKGQRDHWLYFLLKGQLSVVVGKNGAKKTVVNYITPGEVFGDWAVLMDRERTATVVADPNSKQVVAFGTDFHVFGELHDLNQVSLETKLEYYRNVVHNLRWKLEVYRMSYPEHVLASYHRKVKLYAGRKGGVEELESLDDQVKNLARLLMSWNLEFDRLSLVPRDNPAYQPLALFG